jgi:hypothetical protein
LNFVADADRLPRVITDETAARLDAAVEEHGPILIFGLPRSGTTWLAKLFDSHPDTLYRHEPDIVLRDGGVPTSCPPEDWPRYRAPARDYLLRLTRARSFRTAGPLPYFAKSYRRDSFNMLRNTSALALSAVAKASGAITTLQQITLPDYVSARGTVRARTVVKSVSADGRVGLFAEAMPESKILFLIRNPYGLIASRLRGIALGKMRMPIEPDGMDDFTRLVQARSHGLTKAGLLSMRPEEQLAWYWVIMNEKAVDELGGRRRVRIVSYEDLCNDPLAVTRGLFAFAGLDLHRQTEDFIAASSQYEGSERYYQVKKNTQEVAERWRVELPPEARDRIRAVVRHSAALRAYDASE